jgi:leucyl aminopeptidase
MQIRFADARPTGDFALVLPVAAGLRPGLDSLGDAKAGVDGALKRNRFEGESGSIVEHFLDGDGARRLLIVGAGASPTEDDEPEKLGGAAVGRLLTSGETHAVIDLSGLKFDADAAARVALALSGLRPLSHAPKGQAEADLDDGYDCRRRRGGGNALRHPLRIGGRRRGVDANWSPSRPTSSIPRHSSSGSPRASKALGWASGARPRRNGKLGMGAIIGVAQGSVREGKLLVLAERRQRRRGAGRLQQARA